MSHASHSAKASLPIGSPLSSLAFLTTMPTSPFLAYSIQPTGWVLLECLRHALASGPLPWLFALPGMLFTMPRALSPLDFTVLAGSSMYVAGPYITYATTSHWLRRNFS